MQVRWQYGQMGSGSGADGAVADGSAWAKPPSLSASVQVKPVTDLVDRGRRPARRRGTQGSCFTISDVRPCARSNAPACRARRPWQWLVMPSSTKRCIGKRQRCWTRGTQNSGPKPRLRAKGAGEPIQKATDGVSVGAGGRNRTVTGFKPHGILSPARLPVSPLRPGRRVP